MTDLTKLSDLELYETTSHAATVEWTRRKRWHRTYNAALAGVLADSYTNNERAHAIASRLADRRHGEIPND